MNGKDCWIGLTGENFKIRGPNYLKDRKKIMSEECVFKCLCCELVNSKVKMVTSVRVPFLLSKSCVPRDTRVSFMSITLWYVAAGVIEDVGQA